MINNIRRIFFDISLKFQSLLNLKIVLPLINSNENFLIFENWKV
jgi:hypothetical protein